MWLCGGEGGACARCVHESACMRLEQSGEGMSHLIKGDISGAVKRIVVTGTRRPSEEEEEESREEAWEEPHHRCLRAGDNSHILAVQTSAVASSVWYKSAKISHLHLLAGEAPR